jgi:hypothetical protein
MELQFSDSGTCKVKLAHGDCKIVGSPPDGAQMRVVVNGSASADYALSGDTVACPWSPDDRVTLSVHVGDALLLSYQFTAPRPRKPYASWSWDGSTWVAPVPMPAAGNYEWDEEDQLWVEIT